MEDLQLELNGVRVTVDYLCWVQDGRPKDLIPRAQAQRIIVKYGSQAPRPATQLIVGVVMLPFIAWPLFHTWMFTKYGGTLHGIEFMLSAFTFLGAWLIYDALKKGWYLDVEAAGKHKKLPFARGTTRQHVSAYLSRVRNELRYTIESSEVCRWAV